MTQRARAELFREPASYEAPERHGEPRSAPEAPEQGAAPMSAAMWQQQATRYAADLATLNARLVRWRGLLVACLPTAPAHLRAHIERELGEHR